MNIGINCIATDPTYRGGVNSYTLGLLKGLASVSHNNKIQLYVTEYNRGLFDSFKFDPRIEIISFPVTEKLNRAVGRSIYIGKILHRVISDLAFSPYSKIMNECSDLIYIPTTTLFPYTFLKPTLLSMHDIQQVHYPQYFRWRERINRNVRFNLSAELATYIQASSQFIKEDLLSHFTHLKPEQIVVIHEGVDIKTFSTPTDIDVVDKYGLPSEFLFYPAQLWLHKNHITVLKAIKRLKFEHKLSIPLVLTGAKYSGSDPIFRYITDHDLSHVHYLGIVPYEDMIALYQRSKFLITAVLYESSSLPFLEAAAAGCPVLASDTSPNREMSQLLKCELFKPLDDKDLAELLLRVWDDNLLISEHISHNHEAVGYYSWDNAALRYLDFINTRILC